MAGLFRFLFLVVTFLIVRRLISGVLRTRAKAAPERRAAQETNEAKSSPAGKTPGDNLAGGQRIEEADYEELD